MIMELSYQIFFVFSYSNATSYITFLLTEVYEYFQTVYVIDDRKCLEKIKFTTFYETDLNA